MRTAFYEDSKTRMTAACFGRRTAHTWASCCSSLRMPAAASPLSLSALCSLTGLLVHIQLAENLKAKARLHREVFFRPRFLRALPEEDAATSALALVGAAADAQTRRALVAFLSTLAPNLANADLAAQLARTQLGLDALARVPPPWDERVGHLTGGCA